MVGTSDNLFYFKQIDENQFQACDPARGPWSPDHCHAGPVTGLVARALERALPDKMLTRLTLDLVRATPMEEIHVFAEIIHEGRTVATGAAEIRDAQGRLCVSARSMHLSRVEFAEMPTAPESAPEFGGTIAGAGPLKGSAHGLPTFGAYIETTYLPGEEDRVGPKTIWMRTPPLLENEAPSPIQSLCPLADCGNGISYNAPLGEMSFMNTDLTIHIHREPESDWLASKSESHWRRNGVGMSHSVLYDRNGPVGVALQSLALRPQKK